MHRTNPSGALANQEVKMSVVEQSEPRSSRSSNAIRPLGSFEHMFWLMDQTSPVHFAVAAQIAGRTNPRDWRSALNRVQERHPLLSVRIENQPGRGPWFKHVPNVPIPLRIVEKEPATTWETEIGKELATPFDANNAPLIRAVLIQGVEEAAFILVTHHAIADGKSLVYLVRDTLRALTGAPLEPLPAQPATDEMLALDFLQLRQGGEEPAAAGAPSVYRTRDGAPADNPRLVPSARFDRDPKETIAIRGRHGARGAKRRFGTRRQARAEKLEAEAGPGDVASRRAARSAGRRGLRGLSQRRHRRVRRGNDGLLGPRPLRQQQRRFGKVAR